MITHDATDKPKNAHKRNEQPTLTPSMALEILQTSLNYVRGCGLAVRISNHHGLCVIGIAGRNGTMAHTAAQAADAHRVTRISFTTSLRYATVARRQSENQAAASTR